MSGLPPRPDGAVPPPPGPRRETGGRFRGRDDRPPRGRGRGRGGDRAYNPRYARDSYPANDSFRDEYPDRGDRGWQENTRSRGYGRPYPESRPPPRREPERDTYYAGASRGYDDRRDPYPSTSRDLPPPRGRYDREPSPRRDVYDRRADYRRRTPSPRRGAYPPQSPSMSRGRYPPDYERPSSRSSSRSRFTESPVVNKLQRESYDRPATDNDELEAGQLISEPEPPSPPPPLIHRISSPRRSPPPPPPSRLPGRRRQPRKWDAPGPGRRRDASPPTQPRFRGNWQPITTDRARTPSPPPEEPKEEDVEMAPPPPAAQAQPSYNEPISAEMQPEPATTLAAAPGPPVPANHGDIVKQAYGNMPTPIIVPASAPSGPAPKKASWAKAAMVPANVHIVSTPAASTSQPIPVAPQTAPAASQPVSGPPPAAPTPAPAKTEPKDEPMEVDQVPAKQPTPRAPSPLPEIKSPELKVESPPEPHASQASQPTPAQASPATPNPAHAPPPKDIKGKGRLGAPPSQPRGFTLPTEPRSMAAHANDSRGHASHPIPTGPRLNRNASLSTSTSGPSSLPAKPDSLPPTPVLPSPAAASPLARDSPAVAATPVVSLPPTPATSTPVAGPSATLVTPTPTAVMGSPSLGVAGSSDSPAILPPGGIKRELSTASSAPPEASANAAEVKAEGEDPHHFRVRAYVPHHERQALARKRLKAPQYEEPRTDLDALYDERQSFYAQLRSFQHAVARKNSEYAASAAATGRALLEYELAGNEVRYAQMRHTMAEEQTELAKRGCLGVEYGK